MSQKRGKVFTWPVSAIATLKAKGILLLEDRKCELTAKVRLANLRDDAVLEKQQLPDQERWDQMCQYVGHVFGITLPALPTVANLQKLHDNAQALTKSHGGAVAGYLRKLRDVLPGVVAKAEETARMQTAVAVTALCEAVQGSRKPADTFGAIEAAPVTQAPAMGEAFKQASRAQNALGQFRLDVYQKLGGLVDEPRASVAAGLRSQLEEALRTDEHASPLDGVMGRWMDDAMKLLLDAPPPPPPPPQQPVVPRALTPPGFPPPVAATPGVKVVTGQRRVTGKSQCKDLLQEIERELTDDAELELSWRIVRKQAK